MGSPLSGPRFATPVLDRRNRRKPGPPEGGTTSLALSVSVFVSKFVVPPLGGPDLLDGVSRSRFMLLPSIGGRNVKMLYRMPPSA